ncbi:hypothetical protein KAJ26_02035 [bacterium]|nr:hypothetical protein [bacterium]
MIDPLRFLLQRHGFIHNLVSQVEFGKKYSAVMLKDGSIGVCANPGGALSVDHSSSLFPDLDNLADRIIYNCYVNAIFNIDSPHLSHMDIFEAIDFSSFDCIVMIGMFRPLVRKFNSENISLAVFDRDPTKSDSFSVEDEFASLEKADCVIMTATAVSNGTYVSLLEHISEDASIYLLGPSATNDPEMMREYRINGIFSSVFEKNDMKILDIISRGGGTKEFQPHGKKTILFSDQV